MNKIQSLCKRLDEIASLPSDRPQGLSGIYYSDPDYFAYEKQTVLKNNWHCLGRVDEVPSPGDYFTTQVLDEPLLVVRGDNGDIKVMSNLCRHRGMPLAKGRGHTKRFVCSYHAWIYGRDGTLLRAARMENAGFDQANCRLPEFSTEIWQGFIYCAIGKDPKPFFPARAALEPLISPYETEKMRLVHVAESDWHTNWKCLIENFMEGYHLSVVHPTTLHGYTPTNLAEKSVSGPGFTSYCAVYPKDIASRGKGAVGLSQQQRNQSVLFSVFPTHLASQSASLLVAIYILPLTVDRIRVKWTMSVYGDDLDEEIIQSRITLWENVNREDREKLEWMQNGLASSNAGSGPLAAENYEGTIRDFQHWLSEANRPAEGCLESVE